MKDIIHFFRQLQVNNDREWFNAHKAEFKQLEAKFHSLVDEVIQEIAKFDPTVANLRTKDCTYRIYRDVRFSSDKSPYKCHFGAFITRGGKKSGYSGYYFHISTGGSDAYPYCHILAAGDYCCTSEVLKILREDIVDGEGDFDRIVKQAYPTFTLDAENALKRLPKGFPEDTPYPEYIKLKNFCLVHHPSDEFWNRENLAQRIAEQFALTRPFVHYINRAIEYVTEEQG
ncbi:MAG: DUF2461 domain-containing protein [Bacteroidaceae bacterium]|nr:DUF2461 domain-containing protein [Bacteroidaceae bacterium]